MIRRSLLLTLLCGAAVFTAQAQDGAVSPAVPSAMSPALPSPAPPTVSSTEPVLAPLQKIDVHVGAGAEAEIASTVYVHYTGWLFKSMAPKQRGRKFDSSVGREPLEFQLGAGRVIKGWEQGILGMKVGGKRTLIIPAHLAYGHRAMGDSIPADSDLIFDVELMNVK